MIQDLISRLGIGQQLNEIDTIAGTRSERANDKIEVFTGKSCPTVRLNHRDKLYSITCAELEV